MTDQPKSIAVIGAGSWGTALSIVAARAGHDVVLWSRDADVVKSINESRVNHRYLSDQLLPDRVIATTELGAAARDRQIVVLAAPSHALRQLLEGIGRNLSTDAVLVSATKGIEIESGKRISELVSEIQGETTRFVCLSGPSFAKEVVNRHPTAVVAASIDLKNARLVQQALSFDNLRIYTNSDVVGTELGGSVKNVMAIAAGMTSGLGYGSNSVAALITRGLAEMTRLALKQGAQSETLVGLAGLGDLVLTCTGSLSRNRFVGEQLGKGRSINEITAEMNEVAEGIRTASAVKRLADISGVEMPITNQVNEVIYGGKAARDAVVELMTRPLRDET